MAMRGKRHREAGPLRGECAELSETWMKRGLAATKANAERSVFIEFGQPLANTRRVEPRTVFRRVAVWARQLTHVRERDGDLARRNVPGLAWETEFFNQQIEPGAPIEKMDPAGTSAMFCRDVSGSCRVHGWGNDVTTPGTRGQGAIVAKKAPISFGRTLIFPKDRFDSFASRGTTRLRAATLARREE